MKKVFYVDLAMCGGEDLPPDFDLEAFCEVLQGKVPEIEIEPVTESMKGAEGLNAEPHLIPDSVFNEALGEYSPH